MVGQAEESVNVSAKVTGRFHVQVATQLAVIVGPFVRLLKHNAMFVEILENRIVNSPTDAQVLGVGTVAGVHFPI